MTKPKKKARTDMRIYMQIFHLKFDRHLSNRQIALTLNIGRSTVNDLIVRFGHLGFQWPPEFDSLETKKPVFGQFRTHLLGCRPFFAKSRVLARL